MSGLRRIETKRGHRYTLDGKPVQGVTTLLSKGLPKPAIPYWAAREIAEWVTDHPDDLERLRSMGRGPMVSALKGIPWETRDRAAIRGTDVHALAEQLVHGEEVEVPDHLAGHVEAYVDFLDRWRPEPVLTEFTCASRRWHYAGTADLVVDLPDDLADRCPQLGKRPLLDIKTSSGVYGETALQLAAYRYSEFYLQDGEEHATADLGITGAGVIHVRSDGWDLVPVRADDYVFKRFLYVAQTARTADETKEYLAPALPVPDVEAVA